MSTLLSIDTSTELASVALLHDGKVSYRDIQGVQKHSASLLPAIAELMGDTGVRWADCDAIAFSAGPGSFTGLRTACGVAQGLAYGAALPVIAVSTLETMAEAWRGTLKPDCAAGTEVVALLDARMNDLYFAKYRFDGRQWQQLASPGLASAATLLARYRQSRADDDLFRGTVLCGNGIQIMAALDSADAPDGALQTFSADLLANGRCQPHACAQVRIAALLWQDGKTVPAEQAMPVYVRNHVADTILEREQAAALKKNKLFTEARA